MKECIDNGKEENNFYRKKSNVLSYLGEIWKYGDCLSIAVMRSSIIGASLKEPCPGSVDSISGVTNTFIDNSF